MENEFEYENSLDYFEQIYYTKNGELRKEDWSGRSLNSKTYYKIGVYNEHTRSGQSKIVGRSAFTPRIVRKPVDGIWKTDDETTEYKYFLTLDSQGKFDHHFDQFYMLNENNIQEIDITDMSKEDVLEEVKQILTMSNEQIMEKFNINRTYSAQVKLELILDDAIKDYLINRRIGIIDSSYGPQWGMKIYTSIGNIEQTHSMLSERSSTLDVLDKDKIQYKLVSGLDDYKDIRVEIDEEETNVRTAIGKHVLETLRTRFTEKEVKKEDNEEQKEIVQENNLDNANPYEEYSVSELQLELEKKEYSNRQRKKEIEELEQKNELIRKILAAKEEGKKLDSRIAELKNEFAKEEQ